LSYIDHYHERIKSKIASYGYAGWAVLEWECAGPEVLNTTLVIPIVLIFAFTGLFFFTCDAEIKKYYKMYHALSINLNFI
jgi:hypothetical protein